MIEVASLSCYYGAYCAVNAISFTVGRGEIFGLLGPNGAGKTTTIKVLTTLLPPTSGHVRIHGYDLTSDPIAIRERIGYVSQMLSADGALSGYENLLLSAKLYGLPSALRETRIKDLLDFMSLSDVAHQLVKRYSGGMVRRLEIAQALIHQPEILFLDEPTAGLDPSGRQTLWRRLREWRKKFGITILLTTHDMLEADHLCDQLAFMHAGEIAVQGSPKALKNTLGPHATLDDVFMKYTGATMNLKGDYHHVRQVRRTLSKR